MKPYHIILLAALTSTIPIDAISSGKYTVRVDAGMGDFYGESCSVLFSSYRVGNREEGASWVLCDDMRYISTYGVECSLDDIGCIKDFTSLRAITDINNPYNLTVRVGNHATEEGAPNLFVSSLCRTERHATNSGGEKFLRIVCSHAGPDTDGDDSYTLDRMPSICDINHIIPGCLNEFEPSMAFIHWCNVHNEEWECQAAQSFYGSNMPLTHQEEKQSEPSESKKRFLNFLKSLREKTRPVKTVLEEISSYHPSRCEVKPEYAGCSQIQEPKDLRDLCMINKDLYYCRENCKKNNNLPHC